MKEDKKIVLIGVLKNKRDLGLLLKKKQYRIPAISMPRRKAGYIAFYQPSALGRQGRMIRRYARIINCGIAKRKFIVPGEPDHPGLMKIITFCRLTISASSRPRSGTGAGPA